MLHYQGGTLTKQPLSEFMKVLLNLAGAHFVCCSAFLPLMAEQQGSSYTFIAGQYAFSLAAAICHSAGLVVHCI